MSHPYPINCKKCNKKICVASRKIKLCLACRYDNGTHKKKSMYSDNFKKIKTLILQRDNNQCQCCKRNVKLLVHHMDCNDRNNDPNNLITLCNQCHLSLHSKYEHSFLRKNDIRMIFPEIEYGKYGVRLLYK